MPVVPSSARPAPGLTPCPAHVARPWLAALAPRASSHTLGRGVWSRRAHPVPGHTCEDAADG